MYSAFMLVVHFFAGCLIDIISTKGPSGFIAFLEVVEYEYGDLFLEITGKQPRMPPRGQPKQCSFKINTSSCLVLHKRDLIEFDTIFQTTSLSG